MITLAIVAGAVAIGLALGGGVYKILDRDWGPR